MKVFDYALRLLLVCAVASGMLAYVYQSTDARIKENVQNDKMLKAKSLLPPDTIRVEEYNANGMIFFKGFSKDGLQTGIVLESSSKGYGGAIKLLTAIDNNAKVMDVAIVAHSETPGLGSKVENASFLAQFKGKAAQQLILKKDSVQAGSIDAIAAATISSRAVTNAVKVAVEQYREVSNAR